MVEKLSKKDGKKSHFNDQMDFCKKSIGKAGSYLPKNHKLIDRSISAILPALRFFEGGGMKQLSDLKNVGKATLEDLHLLGIHTIEELSNKDPTTLFYDLERRTKARQDPCVWDVFAAIIHEASGGQPTSWWKWTKERKTLQKKGQLNHVV